MLQFCLNCLLICAVMYTYCWSCGVWWMGGLCGAVVGVILVYFNYVCLYYKIKYWVMLICESVVHL
jgi:hypothetical protein